MQNFRALLDRQKNYFNTDATKTYEWRIEQLDRMHECSGRTLCP
jgi:aldehyde dehydrogenase (NAD+)